MFRCFRNFVFPARASELFSTRPPKALIALSNTELYSSSTKTTEYRSSFARCRPYSTDRALIPYTSSSGPLRSRVTRRVRSTRCPTAAIAALATA